MSNNFRIQSFGTASAFDPYGIDYSSFSNESDSGTSSDITSVVLGCPQGGLVIGQDGTVTVTPPGNTYVGCNAGQFSASSSSSTRPGSRLCKSKF